MDDIHILNNINSNTIMATTSITRSLIAIDSHLHPIHTLQYCTP